MALYYTVDYNYLTNDDEYFIHIHPQGSSGEDELAKVISEESSFSVMDIKGMLLGFPTQIARILASGRNTLLQDFLGFSVSCRLKKGVKVTDPNYALRSEDIDLHINVNSKAPFSRLLLNTLLQQKQPFIKLNTAKSKPQITEVIDFKTQEKGKYSPSNTFGISGAHFNSPKEIRTLATNCGVFFKLADNSEQRASIYSLYKHDAIHCTIPANVQGKVSVIVRQYSDNQLVEAVLPDVTESQ